MRALHARSVIMEYLIKDLGHTYYIMKRFRACIIQHARAHTHHAHTSYTHITHTCTDTNTQTHTVPRTAFIAIFPSLVAVFGRDILRPLKFLKQQGMHTVRHSQNSAPAVFTG